MTTKSSCANNATNIIRLYSGTQRKKQLLHNSKIGSELAQQIFGAQHQENIFEVTSETCFHILLDSKITNPQKFMGENEKKICWLLAHDVFHQDLHKSSQLNAAEKHSAHELMIEIGPSPTMTTAFSTNAVSACRSAGIKGIQRLEQSQRYLILLSANASQAQCSQFQTFLSSADCRLALLNCLGDKMTECEYVAGNLPDFAMLNKEDKFDGKASFQVIDVIDAAHGEANLRDADQKLGLALDQSDFDFYLKFFRDRLQRNPTDVELFDLAQSNSEHSRHWFFKGNMIVDGVQRLESLFKTIQKTQLSSNNNNVICFSDNSRFFNASSGLHVRLLDMQDLPGEDAQLVYQFIVKVLKKHGLTFDNLVSFCADNAPVNFGGAKHQGQNNVFKFLRERTTNLIPIGCPAHILHNSAQKAAERLPFDIENIVFKLGSHFKGSTQRHEKLKEFCELVEVNYNTLPTHGPTRWTTSGLDYKCGEMFKLLMSDDELRRKIGGVGKYC